MTTPHVSHPAVKTHKRLGSVAKLVAWVFSVATAAVTVFTFARTYGLIGAPAPAALTVGALRVSWVSLSPAVDTATALGDTVRLAATVSDDNGTALVGATIHWSSDDSSVVEALPAGRIVARRPGEATIVATVGDRLARARVVVRQRVATVRLNGDSTLIVGEDERRPVPLLTLDPRGHPVRSRRARWSSADTTIAAVASLGTVAARAQGRTVITAEVDGSSAEVPVSIVAVPALLDLTAGTGQRAMAGAPLPERIAVRVLSSHGKPISGIPVSFRVADARGRAEPTTAVSDDHGVARTSWTLAPVPGRQRLLAATDRLDSAATIVAEAEPVAANTRVAALRTGLTGRVGEPLADTAGVRLTDSLGRALADVPVSWSADERGLAVPIGDRSDSLGEARALWLGALPMSCLDRLQSRPGARGGGRGASGGGDSSNRTGRDSSADSATRGRGARGPTQAGTNSGAGYFWVPTYKLVADHDRLRAFWGCNDWHSAVGSTWVTVRLLKSYPNSALRELAREKLNAHLGKSNLDGEIEFFRATAAAINPIPSASQTGLFERPYGFAWLLELAQELRTSTDSQSQRWSSNVAPLASWMADSLGAYLTKLVEPVRGGAQNNTALSMTLALDYADLAGDGKLRRAIVSTARKFYLSDTTCATQNERIVAASGRGGRGGGRAAARGANADSSARIFAPNDLSAGAGRGAPPPAGGGGPEIVSPCLTEAALMGRVLDSRSYLTWLGNFLPPLESGRFAPLTEAIAIPASAPPGRGGGGAAPDTSAAGAAAALANEHARIAGLSFARAQAMERIARALPANDARVAALHRLSAIQADRGFTLLRDDTAGMSWLPAQALLYQMVRQ